MTTLALRQRLSTLYQCFKDSIYGPQQEYDGSLNGPFLISPGAEYSNSATRLAVVGQETNGWPTYEDISRQMAVYEAFRLGANYSASPFWNIIRKLERGIVGREYSVAWLNINRYDQNNGSPSEACRMVLQRLDWLLAEEIRLLQPEIVIFLTGPQYDSRVLNLLNANISQVGNAPTRTLCKIETPISGATFFRTYHPHYLRRSGKEHDVVNLLVAAC